jgi:hypothetical protein
MKQRLTRWLPARPHTCPLIVYTWNYLSCFAQLAASNRNTTAGFPNRKGTSQYTSNPTVTHRNYTGHVPLAPYTCSDISTHRMHTPFVLYTTPARTVRASQNLVLTILGFSQIETIARINMQKLCTFETADTKQTHQQTAHSAHCLHNNVSSNWSIRIKMQNTEKFPWQWKKDHGHPRSPTCIGKIIILI